MAKSYFKQEHDFAKRCAEAARIRDKYPDRIPSSFGSITSTPMPDANLNYSDLLDTTKELFHRMFPDEEFFPEAAFSEPDDGRLDQSPNSDLVDAGGHNQSPAEESLDSQQQLD